MIDSYTKYADSYFGDWKMTNLPVEDRDEVRATLAVIASHHEHADNFRVEPLTRFKEYMDKKNRGCCGSFDSQVKCLSGKLYLIGFNYGH